LSKKATFPVAAVGVTLAVSVTAVPSAVLVGEAPSVVAVVEVMVTLVAGEEVLAAKLAVAV
jgi:hypothetical protein